MAAFGEILLFAVLCGAGHDLLDMMPTEAYWQAKGVTVSAETMLAELTPPAKPDAAEWIAKLGHEKADVREEATKKLQGMGAAILPQLQAAAKSDDAEVAARANMLIGKITGGGARAAEVRRLMAIRTLGELKAADALPALKKLTASKELFVAEYAKAAVAAIEGKPYKRPATDAKAFQEDLWLLPRNCGLVAQVASSGQPLPKLQDWIATMGGPGAPDGPRASAPDGPEAMTRRFTEMLIKAAEQVGNVRLDGLTFGLSDNVSNKTGFLVLVARGQYDSEAVAGLLARGRRAQGPETVEGLKVYRPEREFAIMVPSTDRLVVVGGPARKDPLPVEAMAKAIKTGKGELANNTEMAKLIQATDRTGPVWAVARIGEAYQKAEFLRAFHTVTLTSTQGKELLELNLRAEGGEPNEVAQSYAIMEKGLAKLRGEIARHADEAPPLKTFAEVLQAIQLHLDGKVVTATAKLRTPFQFIPMMLFWTVGRNTHAVEAKAAVGANPAPVRVR
ncbi:MAG TPA: hypothetical protein VNA25_22520 [Phycisphaerae bacterium]|nr:hypothetical protein [Phycisphaerae bacterium]